VDRYRPAVIIGYPSWLFALAQRRLGTAARRRVAEPRFMLSTGELLYEFQRQAIESAFGSRVVEEYGSQDVGQIASEDEAGSWRVNWEHVVVEVLRNGAAASAGETGEVVVTNLHSHVMPFIRYATGDVVTLPGAAPPRTAPGFTTIPRLEGRASDLLVGVDGRLCSNRDLVDMLVRETNVTNFSLHQTTPDRILCLTTREHGWVGQEALVADLLRSQLGPSLQVDWRIGSAFRPLKSGKRRYVCSPVAQSLVAHDRESGMFLSRAFPQRVLDAS
jgi:phenylacetate-CoA ligase